MPKRGAKKPDKRLDLPAAPTTTKILPMELRVGDRLTHETGQWEVVGRPYTTACGKIVHVRVLRLDKPVATELRTWGANKRPPAQRSPTCSTTSSPTSGFAA